MGVWGKLGAIAFAFAAATPVAAGPCSPLPDVQLQVELSSELSTLIVGDLNRFTGRVRNTSLAAATNLRFELRGWEQHLSKIGVIVVDPTPNPPLSLDGGAALDLWSSRIGSNVGTASVVLAVRYEVAAGCAEEARYEDRTALSAPVEINVVPSTSCWGDCDGSRSVTVDEIQALVGSALGDGGSDCATVPNPGEDVSVDELVAAITNALQGCPLPRPCGGPEARICPGRGWCEFSPGTCGADEAIGSCMDGGKYCYIVRAAAGGNEEVCGCDGTTYASECERRNARASAAHHGACSPF